MGEHEIAGRLNRLDTCAVSDAMDKLELRGVVTGIHQFSTNRRIAGRVLTVKLGIDDGRQTAPVEAIQQSRSIELRRHERMKAADPRPPAEQIRGATLERSRAAPGQNHAQLLVAVDGRPKNVVADVVAVQEIHRGSLEHDQHMRDELHLLLVHLPMLRRGGESLARDRVNVHGDVFSRAHALRSHVAFDLARLSPLRDEQDAEH